eukprot:1472160-Amphidinium_carterae.1
MLSSVTFSGLGRAATAALSLQPRQAIQNKSSVPHLEQTESSRVQTEVVRSLIKHSGPTPGALPKPT